MKKLILVTALTALSACTWVEPKPEAAGIRLVSASDVGHCQRLGSASAKGVSKLGIYVRKDEKVMGELADLARDQAYNMGGDTLVSESELSPEGEMKFGVYRCQ